VKTEKNINNNKGFTLLEIIIVVSIISIMMLLIVPRITSSLDSRRNNFFILTTVIAKTFDDSFLRERTNFLMLHLYEPMEEDVEIENEICSRTNGVSVVTLNDDGNVIDSTNTRLKYREFPEDLKIEEVVLSTGEKIGLGNVLIPFYPKGYSDNVIIHILVDDEERWSVKIFKLQKEPEIIPEYVDFDES